MAPRTRKVTVVDHSALARRLGKRLRKFRVARGLTQRALAQPRYTAAYISALETGNAKPSMAALSWIADRLQVPMPTLLETDQPVAAIEPLGSIVHAEVTTDAVHVRLDDGRAMSVPASWVPELADATIAQARAWSVTDAGQTLRWPALGAELTMRVLARGRSGAERGED